jgi:hypothetical protein
MDEGFCALSLKSCRREPCGQGQRVVAFTAALATVAPVVTAPDEDFALDVDGLTTTSTTGCTLLW